MNESPPAFSVVVPNWNGAAFLRRGLGSLFLSARATGLPFEMVVVDDASTDDGVALIQREFPSIRLIVHATNQGFGPTANECVREARSPLVVLCNNDLIAREEFIAHLIEAISDDSVFAASARTIDWEDGRPNHVEMHAVWAEGLLAQDYSEPMEPCETAFFQGGACILRRAAFLEMGGFCGLFAPGYWEDYDLSYFARKAGWRIVYEPRAVANHLGKGSMISRYGRDRLEIIRHRNQILFSWLNLSDGRLWMRHCLELPLAIMRDLAHRENSPLAKGLLRALKHIPSVAAIRRRRKRMIRLSDREILR